MNKPAIELHQEHFLDHQWDFLNSTDRTIGLIGGLGSGKTVSFLFKALYALINRPGASGKANLGILYPTFPMGKSLFFYPFCELLDDAMIPYQANQSELIIKTPYGNITLKSGQFPERIIGDTYTDVGADEIDTLPMPKGMMAIRKLRERNRGRKDSQLFIVSSPEGFSTCYEVLQNNPNPGTKIIHAKTTDNSFLSTSYIEDIKATYDEAMVKAYIEGQFVNLNSMQAHYAFKRDLHVHAVATPPASVPLCIGIDFNVNPMTAAVGYIKDNEFYFFYEYYLRNSNTYLLSDLIAADFQGRQIICYPDPTGISRKTAADTSDMQILQRKGFDLRFIHGITQRRSLNYANGAFAHNRVHIDPCCKYLIADLEQVVTDEHGQIEKPNGTMLTHISDAMRNVIAVHTIETTKQKGKEI